MGTEAGKVAQGLRAQDILLKAPCSNPSTHMDGSQLSAIAVPADTTLPTYLLGHFIRVIHRATWRQNMHTHETIKKFK